VGGVGSGVDEGERDFEVRGVTSEGTETVDREEGFIVQKPRHGAEFLAARTPIGMVCFVFG
jgi:hypothetical protein